MRLLNQMLNLSRIFDCFGRRFDKVVFNLKLLKLVDSDRRPISKQLPLELKKGACESRRLSWVMITVSSITENNGRYAMIHTAIFIFLQILFSIYHIMLLAICTTQVKKRVKKRLKK